jgi:hypothetical protein
VVTESDRTMFVPAPLARQRACLCVMGVEAVEVANDDDGELEGNSGRGAVGLRASPRSSGQPGNADDGDIVVAILNGKTALRRLRIRRKRVILAAENLEFRPIDVNTGSRIIRDAVVGLRRDLLGCRASRAP